MVEQVAWLPTHIYRTWIHIQAVKKAFTSSRITSLPFPRFQSTLFTKVTVKRQHLLFYVRIRIFRSWFVCCLRSLALLYSFKIIHQQTLLSESNRVSKQFICNLQCDTCITEPNWVDGAYSAPQNICFYIINCIKAFLKAPLLFNYNGQYRNWHWTFHINTE